MTLIAIQKPEEFDVSTEDKEVVLGFFGDFSAASKKAQPAFEQFCKENPDTPAYLVDVGKVKGLHKQYGVTSVPTVLLVKGKTVLRKAVGQQTAAQYARLLLGTGVTSAAASKKDGKKKQHRVVVYVTDTCPWCRRVETYLRQNQIPFRPINVQRDQNAAQEMVRRSGQQGVPQIDIDGQFVVGFDKPKIDALLGLNGGPN